MVWKNLKKWLGIGALAGSLLMPSVAKGDSLEVGNMGDSVNVYGSVMYNRHSSGYLEGDGGDTTWDSQPSNPNNKWLKIYSEPYGVQLYSDGRPPESDTLFQDKLMVVDKIGDGATSTNRLRFRFPGGAANSDSTRHYTAKIHCDGTYTPNGTNFDKQVNIRDVISADSGYVNLPGIVNCPSGTVYGTVDVNPQFNRLVSSKTGNGTNSFEGNTIFNYQDNTNVVLNANTGNYIDYYVLTRTDSTGIVNAVTNDIAGTSVTSTNISINGIMGSNAIYAVYAAMPTFDLTVNSAHGGAYPGTTNNVASGTTLEQIIMNSPVSLGEGVRAVANGGSVTGNDYTQNSLTNISINGNGLTNDATLNWNWQTQAMFNASSVNGTLTGDTNGWKNLEDIVTITNNPAEHYHPVGNVWFGDTNGCTTNGNSISIPMNQARNITASNEVDKYTIAVSNGLNGAVVPGTVQVPYNGSKNFHIVAGNDYEISEVKTNGVPILDASGKQSYDVTFNNVDTNHVISTTYNDKILPLGTPQTWLNGIYGLGTNELADSDNDGRLNWREYQADSNPTNAQSHLSDLEIKMANNEVKLIMGKPGTYNTSTACNYNIYSTTNLVNPEWTTNFNFDGNGSIMTNSESLVNQAVFYKAGVKRKEN